MDALNIKRSACFRFTALLFSGALAGNASAASLPYVEADDGTYLGGVSCTGNRALGNPFSNYGNKFSSRSIWNSFGHYGNPFSSASPYNEFSSTPPKIIFPDDTYVYLTTSTVKTPSMSPRRLEATLMEKCGLDNPLRGD